MAERTTSDGTSSAEQESAADALDHAANGTSEATPISAARRNKSAADDSDAGPEGVAAKEAKPEVKTAADIVAENAAAKKRAEEEAKAKTPEPSEPATDKPVAQKTAPTKPVATAPKQAVAQKTTIRPAKPDGKGKTAMNAVGSGVNRVRNIAASLVWLVAVVCAGVLALGALFTALDQANKNNEIVSWVLDRGHDLVGPFGDLFQLETAKNTLLVNWAIAALAYLVVGKIAERIIRP
jgi:hypothetical protein